VLVIKTHAKREASSTISRYDEKPSYDSTTLSAFLVGLEKLDVEALMKPKSM
jgi:hypothetical protein